MRPTRFPHFYTEPSSRPLTAVSLFLLCPWERGRGLFLHNALRVVAVQVWSLNQKVWGFLKHSYVHFNKPFRRLMLNLENHWLREMVNTDGGRSAWKGRSQSRLLVCVCVEAGVVTSLPSWEGSQFLLNTPTSGKQNKTKQNIRTKQAWWYVSYENI